MDILEELANTQDPMVRRMIETRRECVLSETEGSHAVSFDNQPTWDNWSKQPDPFKKKTIYFRKK